MSEFPREETPSNKSPARRGRPVLIITYGATGVGKTDLAIYAAQHMRIGPNYVTALVDDLVENDEIYKQKVNAIIEQFKLSGENIDLLTNPSDELFQAFGDAYVDARFTMGCQDTKPPDLPKGKDKWNCDDRNDQILATAIEEKNNIVFETTGANKRGGEVQPVRLQWLYQMVKPKKYYIVAAFSVVRFCELIQRNKTRAVRQMEKYLADRAKAPAPRLPNVLDENDRRDYRELSLKIQEVMDEMIGSCLTSHCTKKMTESCSCDVDEILIYNNNGDRLQLVFNFRKGQTVDYEVLKTDFKQILNMMANVPTGKCFE